MPVDVSQIPRDENGGVRGTFRARHRDPGFTDGVAGISFDHGLSVPLAGYDLIRIVVAMGADIELEPVEPITEPDAPAPSAPPAPPPTAVPLSPVITEPEPEEPVAADELPNDRAALMAMMVARGLVFDPRWSTKRMQQLLSAR